MSSSSQETPGESGHLDFNIYGYDPSQAAAIVFLLAFSLITIAHVALVVRSKIWWYAIVVLGGLCEILGWAGREWSAINVYSLNAFLIQQILLILAPCFFSAVLYASLGVLIRFLGAKYSKLRANLYIWVFCAADLVAIVIQAVGGALASTALADNKSATAGTNIMVAGIAIQCASMVVFCILGIQFFFAARRDGQRTSGGINTFAIFLGWGSFWILVRCIYRLVELAQGWTGYLITHQPYFLCLDAIPMVFTIAGFIPGHPWFCLRHTDALGKNPSWSNEKTDMISA